jgi:hypothetical protein
VTLSDLHAAVLDWQAPEGVELSVTTYPARRHLSVALWHGLEWSAVVSLPPDATAGMVQALLGAAVRRHGVVPGVERAAAEFAAGVRRVGWCGCDGSER